MNNKPNLRDAILRLEGEQSRGMTIIKEDTKDKFIPYGDILQKAKSALTYLQKRGLSKGSKLIFQMEDAEMISYVFWACILGGMIPIPLVLGKKEEHKKMLHKVWEQMDSAYIVSEQTLDDTFQENVILTETIPLDLDVEKNEFFMPDIDWNDTVFFQYSSGSTGEPKGVIISHKNLVTNLWDVKEAHKYTEQDQILSWSSLSHNLGLVLNHILPLYFNYNQYIIPTNLFIQNPSIWMEKATQYHATITTCPNFAYRHFLDMTTKSSYTFYQLSSIRRIINGGEPVSVKNCKEFIEVLAPYGLRNDVICPAYGLSEACLGVTSLNPGEELHILKVARSSLGMGEEIQILQNPLEDGVTISTVGSVYPNVSLRIMNAEQNICGEKIVGSIQLKGDSITSGYYNNTEATKTIFTEDGWLVTGDLGFMYQGNLYITGREKDVIIVKGQNFYVQDLERIVEEVDEVEIGTCAIAGVQDRTQSKEKLIVFLENKRNLYNDIDTVSQRIKQYMLQKIGLLVERVIPIQEIPKTRSNKVSRYELIKRYEDGVYGEQSAWKTQEIRYKNEEEKVQTIIAEKIRTWIGFQIDVRQNMIDAGLDSVTISKLTVFLQEEFNISLPLDFCFQYYSIEKIASYLVKNALNGETSEKSEESERSDKWEGIKKREPNKEDRIAVIGIGCRFPAGNTQKEYWEALIQERDCITDFPESRWKVEKETSYAKVGGFLKDYDYRELDMEFFRLIEKEADYLDPQQRMVLEVAWEALENAEIEPKDLEESQTGVFLGAGSSEYEKQLLKYGRTEQEADSFVASAVSGRLSHFLGLQGPSITIDTACSSSLTAVHLAGKSLLNKECNIALAGGVNVLVDVSTFDTLAKSNMLSKSGKCHTFDCAADGYVRAEGCGMVVLKRESDARRDGNHIYAIIRGSAVNHTGRSGRFTIPSERAEEMVMQKALEDAGVLPSEVSYLEAHGTGTLLGDAMEMQAIEHVFGSASEREDTLYVGSVKANIGHLETASGIAGFIKVILALQNKQIPAQIGCNTLNQYLSKEELIRQKIEIPQRVIPWEGKHRIAGVSAFGFTGTNAHIVVEEAHPYVDQKLPNSPFHRERHWIEPAEQEIVKERQQQGVIRENIPFKDLFYQMDWKEVTVENETYPIDDTYQQYIIFTDVTDFIDKGDSMSEVNICTEMVEQLRSHGKRCIQVDCAEEFQRLGEGHYTLNVLINLHFCKLFEQIKGDMQKYSTCIIYGSALSAKGIEELDGTGLCKEQERILGGLLHILHAVYEIEETEDMIRNHPKIWILTKGCQQEVKHYPSLATLWGFGRTLSVEHPEYWGGMIDLEEKSTKECISKCLWAVSKREMETHLSIHSGKVWTERMVRAEETAQWKDRLKLSSEGYYLITGGLGGLGLETAKWMVSNGARQLILMSRTGMPERHKWSQMKKEGNRIREILGIEALEKGGAEVIILKADVNNLEQIKSALEHKNINGLDIKGVVHAASDFGKLPIQAIDTRTMLYYQKTKFMGTMNLHALTKDCALDFFVMFSSFSAIMGSSHMAHYSAANAFLDAFAKYRRSIGLPATSIAWGAWAGVGSMTRYDDVEQFTKIGHYFFEPETGTQAFGAVIASGAVHNIVVDADWNLFRKVYQMIGNNHIYDALEVRESAAEQQSNDVLIKEATRKRLEEIADAIKECNRKGKKEKLLEFLKCLMTDMLDHNSSKEKYREYNWEHSFLSMGISSVMTVQITQIFNEVLTLKKRVIVSDIYNYTTIESLAEYLLDCMEQLEDNITGYDKLDGFMTEELDNIEEKDVLSELLSQIEGYSDEYIDEKWN